MNKQNTIYQLFHQHVNKIIQVLDFKIYKVIREILIMSKVIYFI